MSSTDVERLVKALYVNKSYDKETDLKSPEYTTLRNGLTCLAKHPILLKHALLELVAKGKDIERIDAIRNFPLLMYVDVSNNSIKDLSPLENLPTLVQIKASHNNLEDCLDFAPPKCSEENSWSSGQCAVGSMLVRADLSHNNIGNLKKDISHHPFLECLLLSHNKISSLNGFQDLRYLQVLDLSYNKIIEITGLDSLPIQELNLRGNSITKLDGLTNLPYLSSLDISENNISCLAPLENCVQLHYLNIRSNKIEIIKQVIFLRELSWLREFLMDGNPASLKYFYRLRVIYILPILSQLDMVVVSAEEKIMAMNLKNDEAGDEEHRSMTFNKYFPDSFVPEVVLSGTSQEFLDDEEDLAIEDLIH
eukprot:gene517-993_t